MKLFALLAIALLTVAGAVSVAADDAVMRKHQHVVHETLVHDRVPNEWRRHAPAHPDKLVELTFAVKHNAAGADELERRLLRAADPAERAHYGQHMSKTDVDALVAPHHDSVAAVRAFIIAHFGADAAASAVESANADFVTVTAPVRHVERALRCRYHTYKHADAADTVITRTTKYHLPSHVAEHVDFVSPTVRFPVLQTKRVTVQLADNAHKQRVKRALDAAAGTGDVAGVDDDAPYRVTPQLLRRLYNVPDTATGRGVASTNVQAIGNFLNQYYKPSDLATFFRRFAPEAVGRTPNIRGPNNASMPGVEASLDVQYLMAMGNNVTTRWWSTSGSQPHNPANEPFLKWLTTVSAQADDELAHTISLSYADNEPTVNIPYAKRVNAEFKKLGARGVTIVFGSGDGGVSGAQSQQCKGGLFVPTFPAASPWVLAVGGTTLANGTPVAASLTGGGFSRVWKRPQFQDTAIATYMKRAAAAGTLPDKWRFQATGTSGFPDVAAQAEQYNVIVNGADQDVAGTSCATPTFTGVLSLVNERRLIAGKSPLGLVAPLFYAHPEVFNDITSGTNPGCNTQGFTAAAGWDPLTGLGTVDYQKLVDLVLSLP